MWKTLVWIMMMLSSLFSGQLPVTPPHTPQSVWSTEDLKEIQNRLPKMMQMFEEHSLQPMGIWVHDGVLNVQVRNLYRHWEHPSDQSMAKLKQALYEVAGAPFPLFLETYALSPDKPEIKGRITAIDEARERALIVDPSEPQSGGDVYAHSVWVQMFKDGNIVRSADKTPLEFKDLKLGQRVEGWTWGMISESLPAQTKLLELSVLDEPEEGGPYFPVTSIIGSDLDGVTKIDVRFGNGQLLTIEDKSFISEITSNVRLAILKKHEDQEPIYGYLYFMELYVGDQKYLYNSSGQYNSVRYTSDPFTKKIDKIILDYGRKHFPDLFKGTEL